MPSRPRSSGIPRPAASWSRPPWITPTAWPRCWWCAAAACCKDSRVSLPPAHAGSEATDAPPTLEDSRKLLESNLYHKELITPDVLEKRHSLSLGRNLETFLERQRVVEPKRTGPRLWERLMEVRAPLLLLYGKQDRNQAAEKCAVLKEQMPELRLEIIDKACHMLMWDAGEVYDRRGGRFSERVTHKAPNFGQPAGASP